MHDPVDGQAPSIRRSLVIGDRLFTVSDGGVMASHLDSLSRVAFVAFPQPQPQPAPSRGPGVVGPPAATRPAQPAGAGSRTR